MKERKNGVSKMVWILYGVMLLLTFVLILLSKGKYRITSPVEQQFKGNLSFAKGWMDDQGNLVDLVNLHKGKKLKAGEEIWLSRQIPEEIEEGYTLNIVAKNVYYECYVDGQRLLDVYQPKGQKVRDSFGRRYSMIPIEKSTAGKTIEMKLILVYNDVNSTFVNVTLGLPQGYLLHFAREKLSSVMTSLLFIFVSILLMLVDIPINMQSEKNHELLALGLFSFVVGMWGLMSTHFVEYFTGDGRTTQIAACLFLALIVLPLVIYIKESMGIFAYRELNVYAIALFVEFMFVWIMEITKIRDVQQTLKCTHIMLILGGLLVLSLFFRKKKTKREALVQKSRMFLGFRNIGWMALAIGMTVDFIRYYRGNVADNAIFVRFGLLIFIMCFGVASLEKTIHAVKIGAKAEFISHLAYEDGLTSLSNRTAFNENLEALCMKEHDIAIIMFDVNNLKKVNDNLGHQYGDEMLVNSARIISDAFVSIGGESYRIGGDEFVVILCKENVRELVADGLEKFTKLISAFNGQEELKYRISIAYGYALLDDEKCSLQELYKVADQRMYECKKEMKAREKEECVVRV